MRDFTCCELTLPTLHDLLQHYEECHADMRAELNPLQHTQPQFNGPPDTRAAIAAAAATNVQQQAQKEQKSFSSSTMAQPAGAQTSSHTVGIPRNAQQHPHFKSGELAKSTLQPVQDMDSVEDMEMDDVTNSNLGSDFGASAHCQPQYQMQERSQILSRSRFGQPASGRVPSLDLNALNFGNTLQMHQGLRQSQPTTPVSGGRSGALYQNNPTVSSVNTPTLVAHPLQQQFRQTPDSSAPGTPGELDPEFLGGVGNMSVDNTQQFMPIQQQGFSGFGFGNGNETVDRCIDEPAKRLFRANGGVHNQQQIQARLSANTQYTAESDFAKVVRDQQRKAGVVDLQLPGDEPKPFRCPVIGCEKAYKNHNGLKYHKTVSLAGLSTQISNGSANLVLQHGHNNQQLHENADGTFSIVDPTTLSPYPGTLGMEKEKPYKCDVCGKRYKNLNGLKYHKSHSPACDPELKLATGRPVNSYDPNVNVAGFGLSGLEEEMVQ